MWFLFIQIFFFMCVSAALGAALAWWWLRRRFVDVTETHAELTRQVETAIGEGRALKLEDIDASLTTALAAYKPPQPDFLPFQDRFQRLEEQASRPDPEMATLKDRLGSIEETLSALSASLDSVKTAQRETVDQAVGTLAERVDGIRMPDIESVNLRVASLAETISSSRPDLTPLQDRLQAVENLVANLRIPEVDLGPVHSGLARLDLSLSELQPPEVDLRPVESRLSLLEERLETLDTKESFAALASDVALVAAELSEITGEMANVSAGITRVSGDVVVVNDALSRLEMPEAPDLDPLQNRLVEIDSSLTDRFALIHDRIAATTPLNDALIATLAAIEADLDVVASRRGPDLEPVFAQLAALDTTIGTIRNELRSQTRLESVERRLVSIQEAVHNPPGGEVSREDLTALEDRLTSIEYGISALHHMLRGRGEPLRPEPEPPRNRTEATSFEKRTVVRTTRQIPDGDYAALKVKRVEAIAKARRPDDQANLLTHAAFGEGDDLAQIVGVGPILTELLHDVGVYYFWQIAEWTDEDVEYVDEKLLHFKGRIERDDWVGQSQMLADLPESAKRPEAN